MTKRSLTNLRAASFLVATILLAGCPVRIEVADPIEKPLIEPLPVTVGVYYEDSFSTYKHKAFSQSMLIDFSYSVGPSSVAMFDEVFSSLFEHVVPVDVYPMAETTSAELDAIIQVKVRQFSATNFAGLTAANPQLGPVHWILIAYDVELFSLKGDVLDHWEISADSEVRGLSWIAAEQNAKKAMKRAMREVAAQFIANFSERSAVKEWLASARHE